MAWIESHQQLGRHPKLLKLAGELRVHRAQAVGHLNYLWWWALDYAPTGDLSALTSAEISAASEWPGDAGKFHTALKESGWLDQDGMIHDWMVYAGRLIESRKEDAERKRRSRAASTGRPPDVHRTSRVPNSTQPTVPNRTVPKAKAAAKTAAFEVPDDLKANEAEVKDWLAYKRERGQTYKAGNGIEALWRRFREIPPERRRAAVDYSMANNYAGLFEKKDGGPSGSKPERVTGTAGYIPGKYSHLGG